MSRESDPGKVELWRARFARHAQSGMKTAEFCAAEGVTQGSFYAWRRKLGLSQPRKTRRSTPEAFQRVAVNPLPVLAARLPGGVLIETSAANEKVLRTIINELVLASQSGEAS